MALTLEGVQGSKDAQVTIQADPNAPKHSVIIDGQFMRGGIWLENPTNAANPLPDYITIRGLVLRNLTSSGIFTEEVGNTDSCLDEQDWPAKSVSSLKKCSSRTSTPFNSG